MFKCLRFRKELRNKRMQVFQEMKDEKDTKRWTELKEQYATYDAMENPGGHIKRDAIFNVGGSMLMLLLVLHYEKLDCVTSKAFGWIKPKV